MLIYSSLSVVGALKVLYDTCYYRNDSSDESRFVTSLVGCLTNIAARETGRAELMSNKDIAKLIQAVVQLVGESFILED